MTLGLNLVLMYLGMESKICTRSFYCSNTTTAWGLLLAKPNMTGVNMLLKVKLKLNGLLASH